MYQTILKTTVNSKKYNIKDQASAIKYFIEQMDIEMIEAFLDVNKTYQDMQKDTFLSKLNNVFEFFKLSGDTYLASYQGKCNNCFKNKIGYTFIGNYSFNYISIIVDSENGNINDMFECSDFKNNDQYQFLNKKLYIDNMFFDFTLNLKK
jgi:hypothetical protein